MLWSYHIFHMHSLRHERDSHLECAVGSDVIEFTLTPLRDGWSLASAHCHCTPQFFVARHAQTRTNSSGARPSGSIASFLSTRHSVKFSSFETFWQWVNGAWRTQIHVSIGVWSSHDAGPPNTMMMSSALRSNVSCTLLISR
jgi:hypothetical protein